MAAMLLPSVGRWTLQQVWIIPALPCCCELMLLTRIVFAAQSAASSTSSGSLASGPKAVTATARTVTAAAAAAASTAGRPVPRQEASLKLSDERLATLHEAQPWTVRGDNVASLYSRQPCLFQGCKARITEVEEPLEPRAAAHTRCISASELIAASFSKMKAAAFLLTLPHALLTPHSQRYLLGNHLEETPVSIASIIVHHANPTLVWVAHCIGHCSAA